MAKAVVVLGGQSNAARISGEVKASLDAAYGSDGYVLVKAYSAGAPLTYSRGSKPDWQTPDELKHQLIEQTSDVLHTIPDSYLAGIIWLQGEADTHSVANPQDYASNFVKLFTDVRHSLESDFGAERAGIGASNIKILNLSESAPEASNRENWDAVRGAIDTLATDLAWVTTLEPDEVADKAGTARASLFSDGLHYSDAFSLTLAKALVAELQASASTRLGTEMADVFLSRIGADTMVGGAGSDIYHVDQIGDRVVEKSGEGLDHVHSSVRFSLRVHNQHLEDLSLTGAADINGTGNSLANTIIGNRGDNVLNGAWGNDHLIGGAGNDTFRDDSGADTMVGGAGSDIYHVDHVGDWVVEKSGEGLDHVHSSVSFSLRAHSQHLEDLSLTGAADINGTGNSLANTIIGNRGDNVLNGAWGNDHLIGGAGNDTFRDDSGADTMVGGAGSDIYHVDHVGDRVVEKSGEGLDHVHSSVSFSLRAHNQHLEDLSLTGAADINGTGNSLANTITGNRGDNVLNGAWGNDHLIGGAGNDTFRDDSGADTMVGGAGSDTFVFSEDFGHDVITDFEVGIMGDKIDLSGAAGIDGFDDLVAHHMRDMGDHVVIFDAIGNSIALNEISLDDVSLSDFTF